MDEIYRLYHICYVLIQNIHTKLLHSKLIGNAKRLYIFFYVDGEI